MTSYLLVFGYYLFDFIVVFFEMSAPYVTILLEALPFVALFVACVVMLRSVYALTKNNHSGVQALKQSIYAYFCVHGLSWLCSLAIGIACFFVAPGMITLLSLVNIGLALSCVMIDYCWLFYASHVVEQQPNIIGFSEHKKALFLDGLMWMSALGLMLGSLLLFNATLLSSSVWLSIVATRCLMDLLMNRTTEQPQDIEAQQKVNYEAPVDIRSLLATGEITTSRVIAAEPRHWHAGI